MPTTVKGNPNAAQFFLTNYVAAQGALPIKVGQDTIGAIGISGAPGGDKDEACAKAGIDKVAAQLARPSSPFSKPRCAVLHLGDSQ